MKNKTLLTLFLTAFFFKLTVFASEPDTLVKNGKNEKTATASLKLFPDDTVQRYIKNLGKDSLVKLITYRINIAHKNLLDNSDKFKYDNSLLEYILFAQYFNLKVDYKNIDTSKMSGSLYRLYDLEYGNTKEAIQIIEGMKANGTNMLETLKAQTLEIIRFSVPFYCEKLTLDKEIYEMIYTNSQKLKINEKMGDYWKFAEINRKCKDEINGSLQYQEKLFEELFEQNNPKTYYLDSLIKIVENDSIASNTSKADSIRTKELEDFRKKFNPNKMLAYALYANDVNLTSYSDNLIYLLDAQQNNGSWALAKKFNSYNSDQASTMYGLWALCEFREKLKKW